MEVREAQKMVGVNFAPKVCRTWLECRQEAGGDRYRAGGRVILWQLVARQGLDLDRHPPLLRPRRSWNR